MLTKVLSFVSLLVISILVFLSACNKSSDEPTNSSLLPEQLVFSKPTPGNKITSEQVKELKKIFSSKDRMKLPEGDLIFPNEETQTLSEKTLKENQLKEVDPNSYQLLKDIQGDCILTKPETKITPDKYGKDLSDLKTGDYVNAKSIMSISGSNCPVDVNFNSEMNVFVRSADKEKRNFQVLFDGKGSMKEVVNSAKYQKLLRSRGVLANANLSALSATKVSNSGSHMTFQISGTYLTLDQEIPITMKFQILNKYDNENGSYLNEVIIQMTLKMKQYTLNIDSHTKTDKSSKDAEIKNVSESYINGHLTTESEFQKMFKDQNPILKISEPLLSFAK